MSAGGGHEPSDVRQRPMILAAGALVVVLVLVGIGQLLLLRYYEARDLAAAGPAAPLRGMQRVAPEPRLLADPRGALLALRAEEDALLHGYAWVNRSAGVVRIPIERAIELLATPDAKEAAR